MIRCEHGMLCGLCVMPRCPHYDELGPVDFDADEGPAYERMDPPTPSRRHVGAATIVEAREPSE